MSFINSSQLVKDVAGSLFSTDDPKGEVDPRDPPCTVYLYTRSVIGGEGKGTGGAKHWLLHFDWGYYSATYDAGDYGGILTPCSNVGEPQAPDNITFKIMQVKSNLCVSPKIVDEKAKANKFSGRKYDLLTANCQKWAQELAKLLGFKLPTGQVEEIADIGFTTLAAGAAVVILGGIAKNN